MKELARKAVTAGAAVGRIPTHRVPDRLEMDPDLVGTPGLESHVGQGVMRQDLANLEVRPRFAGASTAERDALGSAVVATERSVDGSGPRLEVTLE